MKHRRLDGRYRIGCKCPLVRQSDASRSKTGRIRRNDMAAEPAKHDWPDLDEDIATMSIVKPHETIGMRPEVVIRHIRLSRVSRRKVILYEFSRRSSHRGLRGQSHPTFNRCSFGFALEPTRHMARRGARSPMFRTFEPAPGFASSRFTECAAYIGYLPNTANVLGNRSPSPIPGDSCRSLSAPFP